VSGRRSLAERLQRVREWEATRDDGTNDPGPFDVKLALTGVPEDYAVRAVAFVCGVDSPEYLAALQIRGTLIILRPTPGGELVDRWRRWLDVTDSPRALYARAAHIVAEALRDEVNGELVGLGTAPGRFGADARTAAGAALDLARQWEAVAAICRERLPTVDLDRLPGDATPKD
jgi:hypothetical protein